MDTKKTELLIIYGVGCELLDWFGSNIPCELDGLGAIFTTTEDINQCRKKYHFGQSLTPDKVLKTIEGYEGYVLLRK